MNTQHAQDTGKRTEAPQNEGENTLAVLCYGVGLGALLGGAFSFFGPSVSVSVPFSSAFLAAIGFAFFAVAWITKDRERRKG